MKNSKKGFTLIELLIVIALLGALAVGLLAALDPFEQLKKGTDTGVRNTVSEVQEAIIRYYALKNMMPWCASADACGGVTDPSETDLSTAPMASAISNLTSTGELKADFNTLAGQTLGKIFVTGDSTNNTVSVCFKPDSKAFKCDANTKYNQNGSLHTGTTCTDAATCASTTDCYWCVE